MARRPSVPFGRMRLLMRYRSTFLAVTALVLGFCLGVTGCTRAPSEAPAAPPIPVTVCYPVELEVTDYADFTGRIAAVDSVEVRARVWGYLDKVNFKEGVLVKKGDVLFELDPRPYQAMLNQAKAKVAQDEAQLKFDEAEYQRNLRLAATGAVSRSDLDKTAAARGVDLANIAADKAVVASRQLDLDYTKVTAPVSGRASRYTVTVGNLVQSGDQNGGTLLTTIVSVDPMYAYYDVDERTVQRVSQLIREGNSRPARTARSPTSRTSPGPSWEPRARTSSRGWTASRRRASPSFCCPARTPWTPPTASRPRCTSWTPASPEDCATPSTTTPRRSSANPWMKCSTRFATRSS